MHMDPNLIQLVKLKANSLAYTAKNRRYKSSVEETNLLLFYFVKLVNLTITENKKSRSLTINGVKFIIKKQNQMEDYKEKRTMKIV